MINYFAGLFEYEFWANNKILIYMDDNPMGKEIMNIFSHMVADMKPWVMLLCKEPVLVLPTKSRHG